MNKARVIYSVLVVALGAFLIIYGEIDDSPGGQLIGLVAVIVGVVGLVKSKQKNSK